MTRLSYDFRIGDVVPHDPLAVARPGAPRWHALIVSPQREHLVVRLLDRLGVSAFYPVTERVSRRRGKRVVYTSRFLPGYVFARFPGPVCWHVLNRIDDVRDMVRVRDGRPAVLRPDDLDALYALRARDQAEIEDEARARAARRAALRARAGGRARIRSGAYAGKVVDVLEVDGARSRIVLPLFGAAVPGEIETDALIAVDT
jgi:transcription antitermination factor NusG